MALETEQVYLAHAEKPWIGRTVRSMATRTALRFHGYMLEYEGTLFVSVALVTDCVATGQCPDLAERSRAMCVVTIAALNQALIDPVAIRPREVSFRGSVTPVTEFGLSSNQQMLRGLGMMWRVAIQTAHVIAGMRGTGEVPLLVTIAVTRQTPGARFLARQPFKADDLTNVTTAGYVF